MLSLRHVFKLGLSGAAFRVLVVLTVVLHIGLIGEILVVS